MGVRISKKRVVNGRYYGEREVELKGAPAAKLKKSNPYVLRRTLVEGLWEPEDWQWSVVHPGNGAKLVHEDESEWSYDEACALAAELGEQGWTVVPAVNVEDHWTTLLERMRELGWSIRLTFAHACLIEAWKQGLRNRWSGEPDEIVQGMREVALAVIEQVNDPELSNKQRKANRTAIVHRYPIA